MNFSPDDDRVHHSGAGQIEPEVLRRAALIMAAGQLKQADAALHGTHERYLRSRTGPRLSYRYALEHMRAALGWLVTAAQQ